MPPRPQPIALRIELQEISPLIWRRIVVPNQWTFAALHNYLQWVLGWQNSFDLNRLNRDWRPGRRGGR